MTNNDQNSLSTTFANLFDQMKRAPNGPPSDLLKELRALPSCESLPTLWEIWTFFALIEYRERQDWGRQLLIERLPQAVPPCDDYCEQEDQPVQCLLPGMPRWAVTVECMTPQFATLTHRDTGEVIFVDVGATATHPIVNTGWFLQNIRPGSRWEAGGRLLDLTPTVEGWGKPVDVDAVEKLVSEGFLRGVYDDPTDEIRDVWPDTHRLTDKAMRYAPLVLCFCRAWAIPRNRLWASALVGDWFLAHELAVETGDTSLIRVTVNNVAKADSRSHATELVRKPLGR